MKTNKISVVVVTCFMLMASTAFAHNHKTDKDKKDKKQKVIAVAESKESQAKLTAADALVRLKEGNERFVSGTMYARDFDAQVDQTSTGQYPYAVVLSCIDSRIPTEIVFDQGVGDIFNARIAGNFVNEDILGSMEFATAVAGSKLIVVMGHTSCGAVKGAVDNAELGNLTQMLDKIEPAIKKVDHSKYDDKSSKNDAFVDDVATQNVKYNIKQIKEKSPVINELVENGKVEIVGAMYDVHSGKVTFIEI